MSICRRVETNGIYIYQFSGAPPLRYHCQICSLYDGGDWYGRNRLHVLFHALRHKWTDQSIRLWPILQGVWYDS